MTILYITFRYKNVKTPGGVSLAKCIKTGIDNKGHPHIMTCGLVAGDEDCYTTFADLFDIVVGKRSRTNRYIEDIISFIFFKNNKIKDPLCGLKLYKCKILKKINFNNIKTYFFVDLLFNCMLITNKVINIDIKILPRYGVPRIGNFFKVNLKLLNILIYCLFKRL